MTLSEIEPIPMAYNSKLSYLAKELGAIDNDRFMAAVSDSRQGAFFRDEVLSRYASLMSRVNGDYIEETAATIDNGQTNHQPSNQDKSKTHRFRPFERGAREESRKKDHGIEDLYVMLNGKHSYKRYSRLNRRPLFNDMDEVMAWLNR